MISMEPKIAASQAAYTKWNMAVEYDLVVLRYFNRFIWCCPSSNILHLYNQNVTNNHLDVGVGTGFFLKNCRFPQENPRLALMDININSLNRAFKRLKKFNPEVYQRNILSPIFLETGKFDSIGMNYLLHCLPTTMQLKASVFQNLKSLLNPGGVIFGSTILGRGVQHTKKGMRLIKLYNENGIFTNVDDDVDGLESILKNNFSDYHLKVIGSVALFSAKM